MPGRMRVAQSGIEGVTTIADEEGCLHVKTLLYSFHTIIRFLFAWAIFWDQKVRELVEKF